MINLILPNLNRFYKTVFKYTNLKKDYTIQLKYVFVLIFENIIKSVWKVIL